MKKMFKLAIVLGTVLLIACSPKGERESDLLKLVDGFNQRVTSGDFRSIYINASPVLRSVVTEAEFSANLKEVNEYLGEKKSPDLSRLVTTAAPDNSSVSVLVYETQFEKGKGTESFFIHVSDGEAKLYRYEIESDVLPRSTPYSHQEPDEKS
ncbi:DUF4019 domain-containing protein [Pseudomonas tritici]|uniref:DUF4019 domain-containing protein n=1 Tax=Pseudomonas tritici TaxID=2745518 RepID=UPI00387AA75D